MGNLIIKGKGGAGNKLILQDQAGGAVLTTVDSGAALGSTVTGGSGLDALSASNLSAGTVPDARFPATLPAIDGGDLTGVGLIMVNKQSATFYTTTNSEQTFDFTNVPDGATAALCTVYIGSDSDHIDWHIGRATDTGSSWSSGSTDPGWSDGWGDILHTWPGNVGGYSWWQGSMIIPVDSLGRFKARPAGASNLGNRIRFTLIGYFA